MQFLESHTDKIIYALAMRRNPVHQRRFATLALTCMPGSKPEDGLEIADYQSSDWSDGKTRRVVVIRQLIPEDKNAPVIGKQLKLFALRDYTWRAIATNSAAPPEEVWRDYNQRACCENHIKEALDFGLELGCRRSVGFPFSDLPWRSDKNCHGVRLQSCRTGCDRHYEYRRTP